MSAAPEESARPEGSVFPIASATERSLQAAKPDAYGFVRPAAAGAIDAVVGPASVPRVLRLVADLLAKAAVAGIAIRVERERRRTIATVDGEPIAIRLTEGVDRRKHKPTPEERAEARKPFGRKIPEWDYFPSGRLALRICEQCRRPLRRLWADGRQAPLEQKLDSFVAGLQAMAAGLKERRAEHLRRQQEAEERRRRDAEDAERQRREEEFRDALLTEAESWERARLVRAYVRAVVDRVRGCGTSADNAKLDDWVEHALEVADQFDPLEWIEIEQPAAPEMQSR